MNNNFDDLVEEVLSNRNARCAARENSQRRSLAVVFEKARKAKHFSIRALAEEMGTSVSQVQRLLHNELGGSLTLRAIFRAADALDIEVDLTAHSICIPRLSLVQGPVVDARCTQIVPPSIQK